MADIISIDGRMEKKASDEAKDILDFVVQHMGSDAEEDKIQEALDRDAERIFEMRFYPEQYAETVSKLFCEDDDFRKFVSLYMSENEHRKQQVRDFLNEQIEAIENETGTELSEILEGENE